MEIFSEKIKGINQVKYLFFGKNREKILEKSTTVQSMEPDSLSRVRGKNLPI